MKEAETIRGYHLKGRKGLNRWDDLLKEWLLAHERYCRIMKCSDNPAAYWYTERPNVSILNAAAWRCGRIALQEFKTKKVWGKEYWVGRGDLWIRTDTGEKEEFIEAKHKFVSLSGAKGRLPTTIKKSMEEATKAAKEAQGDQRDVTALAVVFAPVYATPKTPTDKIDQLIKEFCETIKSSTDYHALAWCFPKETRKLRGEDEYHYPGITILVKNIGT